MLTVITARAALTSPLTTDTLPARRPGKNPVAEVKAERQHERPVNKGDRNEGLEYLHGHL
jgi:hypothetical protein